jgi:RimJ/RimL family protein N-acetyltransferase
MTEPDLQPTLEGPRVRLRPLAPEDFDALYAVARDPLVWEQHPDSDRHQLDVFTQLFEGGIRSRGALLVLDSASGEVVGSSRYYDWNPASREIAIGYTFLGRKFWGGIYNREVKHLMLGHAFGFADRVWFHVGARNLRSRRAMANVGARLAVEVPGDPAWRGRDMVYFCIERSGWAGLLPGAST